MPVRMPSARLLRLPPGSLLVTFVDEAYPELLKTLADPPLVLWINGPVEILSETCVGVVGSRDALPASLAIARKLGQRAVRRRAHGCQWAGASAWTARRMQGRSMAPAGRSRFWGPVSHGSTRRAIATSRSASRSEAQSSRNCRRTQRRSLHTFRCGTASSAACRGRSSSWRPATRVGLSSPPGWRPSRTGSVLAVPGGPLSGRHRGSHGLIKDGARLVETVEDILDEIHWCGSARRRANTQQPIGNE